MSPMQAELKANKEHVITHCSRDGYMWSECTCGWASQKRGAWDNYQVTDSVKDGDNHLNHQRALYRHIAREESRAMAEQKLQ